MTRKRIEQALGELIARHDDAVDLSAFEPYRDDPVGFARDVLKVEPWLEQEAAMRSVLENDRTVWRGANGVGKDFTVASLALWWAYAVDGLVLLSGPTARQVHEVLMRKEIARAFHRANLPGDLYTQALRIRGDEASILAATSSEAGKLTGFHDDRVLAVLTEAQDVEPFAWEGLMACATGSEDRLLAVGNPLRPSGRFYEVSRVGFGWTSFQTGAHDHPNLDPDSDRWIAGGPSEAWVERMADTYGEESPIWRARVEGDFPDDAVHGLFRREWLEAAGRRWAAVKRREEDLEGWTPLVAALDPSRMGVDASVLAVRRGHVLDELLVWRERQSTTDLVRDVVGELEARGFQRFVRGERDLDRFGRPVRRGARKARGTVVVDEPGMGGPVLDRLEELRFRTRGHNGGRKANDPERFFNLRAEAYWTLARKLEDGALAIAWDDKLHEELCAMEYTLTAGGKVQIEAKEDLKSRIGRSPDRADAVAMAFAEPVAEDRPTTRVSVHSFG